MKEIVTTVDEKTEVLIKRQKEKKKKIESGFDRTKFIFDKLKHALWGLALLHKK